MENQGGGPIVVASGIHKTYNSGKGVTVHALRGIDLTVDKAEVVGIMGPSGCGKTTLLNCLSGLDDVDKGEITIGGIPLNGLDDDSRTDYRARSMGFVFQLYNLLPVLSSVENVELPMLVSGVNSAQARRRAMETLEMVGLTDLGRAQTRRALRRPEAEGHGSPGTGERAGDHLGRRADRGPGL